MQFKKLQRYDRFNPKNFELRLRMSLLQFNGTSTHLFCLSRKPAREKN